ncbi:DUF1433 domain-containing protein [Staphylococcus epidermidis]|uniref:DUF1433 domain-containing protein n=2 Tax=Staphylococcus epidermidis TaxID=1282 RepID=UPI0011A9A316|nr:DUF1433 domain-containing protein [Staphylococcus epidermidis]MCG1067679.1 DUF1433 domain-containing protein [Staphylococcus epidermidis]MCG1102652.1 DUF1433 domain-containing protein [Staphylococcus epidermidis]MCG1907011.1 DUF1433 domain-containing protein [Staphylococcus epidermidis]MCG2086448.1 DUF1433 domain-containing protein [Staphylococcus epidermidis]MCG2189196.1 DUF1433 domain-containing protein [Staphylococcus epidermidis]
MFKNNKIILFAISFFIILTLIIGGFYILHENKRDYYLDIQKKRIDLFFNENVNHYKHFTIVKTEKNPMGDYLIKGYVNNNKELYFTATMNETSDYQFDNQMSMSENLSNMFKTQNDLDKFPSQIIKEKNLNENDYEADPPLIWGF